MMGPLITQSLAQLQASERSVTRPAETKRPVEAKARRRPEDVYETIAAEVESAQAPRRISGNEQEDAHEDRQEHEALPLPRPKPGEHAGIDVNG